MSKMIMDLISELENTKNTVLEIICKTETNSRLINVLENLEYELDIRIADIEYFTLESQEDFLTFDNNSDRFLACDDELTCGRKIEVYNDSDDSWDIGRIESSYKYKTDENPSGYYFYGEIGDNKPLKENMRVRLRSKFR